MGAIAERKTTQQATTATSDFAAIKQKQQATWASGDFATRSPARMSAASAHITALFGTQATAIRATRKHFNFRFRSAAHWIQVFRDYYGPTHKAFAALDAAGQDALANDITELLNRCNIAAPSSLVVPSEYLEVAIDRR